MPHGYVSQAQQGYMHAAAERGEIDPEVVKKFDEETRGQHNLPKHKKCMVPVTKGLLDEPRMDDSHDRQGGPIGGTSNPRPVKTGRKPKGRRSWKPQGGKGVFVPITQTTVFHEQSPCEYETMLGELPQIEKGRVNPKKAEAAGQVAMSFDEEAHPRAPSGSAEGGQFVKKEEAQALSTLTPAVANPSRKRHPAATMSYKEAVELNLKHMGTPASEWRAMGVVGFTETEDAEGRAITLPVFEDAPSGYTSAPTLFKGSSDSPCCELCGAAIKKVYHLQNDTKRWTLPVGSECVTKFEEGKSGEDLSKEAKATMNRDFLREALQTRKELLNLFTRTTDLGYGRKGSAWDHPKARELYFDLKKTTANMDPDHFRYPTQDGPITRWVNKHGDSVRELIEQASTMIEAERKRLELSKLPVLVPVRKSVLQFADPLTGDTGPAEAEILPPILGARTEQEELAVQAIRDRIIPEVEGYIAQMPAMVVGPGNDYSPTEADVAAQAAEYAATLAWMKQQTDANYWLNIEQPTRFRENITRFLANQKQQMELRQTPPSTLPAQPRLLVSITVAP